MRLMMIRDSGLLFGPPYIIFSRSCARNRSNSTPLLTSARIRSSRY